MHHFFWKICHFLMKNPHFSERKIRYFFPSIFNFQDEKITFLRQNFEKFRNFGRFWNNFQTHILKNCKFLTKNQHFSEPKIHFLDDFWEIPLMFHFQFLRRKTDIFKADFWKILAIVQQFLDQNDDKLDIFRAKDSFSDNFGEISLIFNFCTKKLTFEKQKLRNFDNFFDKFDIFWRKTDIF